MDLDCSVFLTSIIANQKVETAISYAPTPISKASQSKFAAKIQNLKETPFAILTELVAVALNYVNSSVYSLQYHLIFETKHRRKVLTSQVLCEIQAKISGLLAKDSSKLIEFNGEADHVHLLLELSPKVSVSEMVGKLKSET